MADNGLWFKLWCSADDDQDLDNLEMADFGRWCKLGAYIKAHGTHGMIRFEPPQRTLCAKLQVDGFNDLLSALKRLPKVTLGEEGKSGTNGVTDATVTYTVGFNNWKKYQEDPAWLRMRKRREKKRQRVTPQRRGEDIRREDIKEDTPSDSLTVKDFIESWNDEFRGALPAVEWPVSDGRRQKIGARLKQHPTIEFWNRVFTRIRASAFLLGQNGTWKCTVDWLCANDTNALKVYEGQYEQQRQKNRS